LVGFHLSLLGFATLGEALEPTAIILEAEVGGFLAFVERKVKGRFEFG
jgi:hypothetical protein